MAQRGRAAPCRPPRDGERRTRPRVDPTGADPTTLHTTARQDGDDWIIDGHKWFCTNGSFADFIIVMVVIFLLSVFALAQHFLSERLSGREEALALAESQAQAAEAARLAVEAERLKLERALADAETTVADRSAALAAAEAAIDAAPVEPIWSTTRTMWSSVNPIWSSILSSIRPLGW